MSEAFEPPTREAAEHPARGAAKYGFTPTKAQTTALDDLGIKRSREHKAYRQAAYIEHEATRDWQAREDDYYRKAAATNEPEDIAPFGEAKPDPAYHAMIARYCRKARADAQNAVSESFRGKDTFAKVEAAFITSQIMPDPEAVTVTEWHTAEVMRDAAAAALHAFNLWLAVDAGANKAEVSLIRRAAKEGKLCSLETSRDIRAGRTPEALAAQAAQEAKAQEAKALNTESSGASARARNPQRDPEVGA